MIPETITRNEEIEGTPFRLVGSQESGYIITIGNYALCQPMELTKALSTVEPTKQWEFIVNLILAIPMIATQAKKSKSQSKSTTQL
jgi:hypothetical protein